VSYSIGRDIIRPIIFPILAFIIVAFFIIAIGEILLNLFESGLGEFERKELWFGVIWGLLIIGVASLLVRPSHVANAKKKQGVLDREVVIGHKSMFIETAPPIAPGSRTGEKGGVRDIAEGYTLYARSGEFAKVIGVLPGGTESGRSFRGYIYAQGVRGASNELWIPIEAVLDVYPETESAFLAIMGDETEAFGWNKPPISFNRAQVVKELPKTL
jgi:hypothetical protein